MKHVKENQEVAYCVSLIYFLESFKDHLLKNILISYSSSYFLQDKSVLKVNL